MLTNDPNNPSQSYSADPRVQADQPQPISTDPRMQVAQPQRISTDPRVQAAQPQQQSLPNAQPGHVYGWRSAQPGYPYTTQQHTQPGYPPVTPYPSNSHPGAPTWYQPGSTLPQVHTLPTSSAPMPRPAHSKMRNGAIFALTCLIAVIFAVGLFSGWTFARYSGNSATASSTSPSTTISTALDDQSAREAAIAKVSPAVVEIVGQISQGTALGSGVIVDKSGDIVTNNHVVSGVSSLEVVLSNGRNVSAQIMGTNPTNDLAVLRIQPYSGMVVATLGDSSKLTIGQEVLAIGNPLGYSGTVTSGVVSALNRDAQESRSVKLSGLIQTSAPINPGNSGGALVTLQGQVVGIPTLSAVDSETNTPANGIGFAIPASQVQATLTQILG